MYGISGDDDYGTAGLDDYGVAGYDEIVGALDELEALDAAAGDSVSVGDGELEGIAGYHHRHRHHHRHHGIAGYDEIIGDLGDVDVGADDIASLMAAAGAAMPHRPMRRHIPVHHPASPRRHIVHHHHPIHHQPCPVCHPPHHH